MANEFYLEAIFIERTIFEDRLESVLRQSGRWKELKLSDWITNKRKIVLVKKTAVGKKGLTHKYFSDELI